MVCCIFSNNEPDTNYRFQSVKRMSYRCIIPRNWLTREISSSPVELPFDPSDQMAVREGEWTFAPLTWSIYK